MVEDRMPTAGSTVDNVIAESTWQANAQLREFAAVDITRAWVRAFQDWQEGRYPSPSDIDLAKIACEFFPEEQHVIGDAGRMDLWASKIETMRQAGTPLLTIAHFILADVLYGDNSVYLVWPVITGQHTEYYANRQKALGAK